MSHAYGLVLTLDGERVLGHFEYNGTVDVACTRIASDKEDVYRTWRSAENHAKCTCGKPSDRVLLRTDYGSGIEWESEACLACAAITGSRSEHEAWEKANPQDNAWGFSTKPALPAARQLRRKRKRK